MRTLLLQDLKEYVEETSEVLDAHRGVLECSQGDDQDDGLVRNCRHWPPPIKCCTRQHSDNPYNNLRLVTKFLLFLVSPQYISVVLL